MSDVRNAEFVIPAGYMAKRIRARFDGLPAHINGVYSVSGCVSDNFTDYVPYWKHNGYWFFDSPELIRGIAQLESLELSGHSLFYYEVFEKEFDGENWSAFEPGFPTNVVTPQQKVLEGFDVVTFYARSSPECSPLSCNSTANELPTNTHCLFASFEEAESSVTKGKFKHAEPGPYRIFAVHSVNWPPEH